MPGGEAARKGTPRLVTLGAHKAAPEGKNGAAMKSARARPAEERSVSVIVNGCEQARGIRFTGA
jgi:hypothetical protein